MAVKRNAKKAAVKRKAPRQPRKSRKAEGSAPRVQVPVPAAPAVMSKEMLFYVLAACFAIVAGLFSLPNYNLLLQPGNPFTDNNIPVPSTPNLFMHLPTQWLLLVGFLALTALWRMVPAVRDEEWDLPPWTARVLFWVLIAVGAWMRMKAAGDAAPGFWDDHYIVTTDIRNILDLNQHPFLFPSGWREPFYPYFTALLWVLFPHATGVFIVHLSCAILDLATIWVLYLAGKELGGRRMGIILMAMAAISKTMTQVCFFGYGCNTTVLACALAFLFFYRLVKKPDMKHFVQWGLALGFGAFCYVPFRTWTPVILGVTWLWVFWDPKERVKDFHRYFLGGGILAGWAFMFLYKNSFVPDTFPAVHLLTSPVFLWLFAAVLGYCYYRTALQVRSGGGGKLLGWATGAILTALIMTPFYLHPHYSEHTAGISVFSKMYAPTGFAEGWRHFVENIGFTQRLMFGQVGDVAQCPAKGDSIFEFYVAACGMLGLAYFAARPTWNKAFVLMMYVTSVIPAVLANAPHSFRLVACDAPLYVAGAWGLNRLWLTFAQTGSKPLRTAGVLLLLAFFGWQLTKDNQWVEIWQARKWPDPVIAVQAEKELPGHRVYIVRHHPGFYTSSQDILCDGKEIFRMNASNPIDLDAGEPGKDLAILVAGEDKDNQKLLEQEFPGLAWKEGKIYWQIPSETPFWKCMEVPFSMVKEGETGLFHAARFTGTSWRRRCYGHYGLGRGLILYEDRVIHWNDNLPPSDCIDWDNSMRVEGDWNVTVPGEYTFTNRTGNILVVTLDGKTIFDHGTWNGSDLRARKVTLTAGIHRFELLTAFTQEHRVPVIGVNPPGGTEVPLDDLAAGPAKP